MNILDRLFNIGKTKPADPFRTSPSFFPQQFVPSDLRLSVEDQLSVSAVYGCVRVIAEAIASSPWNIYTKSFDDVREELEDDAISYILNQRANPEVCAQSFKEAMLIQAMAHGNAFAEIVKDGAGRVVELWLLPSTQVTVMRDSFGELYYLYQNPNGGARVILAPEQVFHYKSLASIDGLMGDSPVGRASKAIAVQFAAERYALNYFGSNARVGGVLKVPRQLQPDEEKALQDSWEAGRAGVRNAFRTAVLPPGVEWTATAANPDEATLESTRKMGVEEIIRYFGVPGHLVGSVASSQGYGKNLAEMGIAFTRNTLRPWKLRLEQEVNYKLFNGRAPKKWAELDLTWLTLGDAMAVAQTQDIYLRNGVFTVNEVREQLGENNIGEEGDERVDLSEVLEPPEPPEVDAAEADAEDDSSGETEGDAGQQTEEMDGPTVGDPSETDGVVALHRMVLSKHQARLKARSDDLRKTLKNGVLQEKLMAALDHSRMLAERDLNHAGLNCPPGWMSALAAVEQGGNPAELAKALNETRN